MHEVQNEKHTNDVLYDLNAMRECSELTDVILNVRGRSFPCHRAVLASCSLYFRTMFNSSYAEAKQDSISIKDVSEVAMATILDYAYTGCLKIEPDQVQEVMSAASLLQVDFVFRKVAKYLKDHLDVQNCADVLMYADIPGDPAIRLKKASEKYMASRFNQVALQPSFLQLSLPQLQSVLNRNDLICTEDDVVEAALRWMESDQEQRLQHLPTLCGSFRRAFISSKCLEELESKCPTAECKLAYSSSMEQRLGQMRTEALIFLMKDLLLFNIHVDSVFLYEPSESKLQQVGKTDLDNYSMAVTSDDELYLAGGVSASNKWESTLSSNWEWKNVFYQYNHLLNTYEPRSNMISPRVRCGLVYLEGYIYAIGGDDTRKSAERYDPSCDKWTSIAPIPQPTSQELCAVALEGSIYVISGAGCFRYSATENTWSKMADMLTPPSCPQAVTHQGFVYCMDCDKYLRDYCVEVYNPLNDTWKRTGGNQTFSGNVANLMACMGSLFILTVSHILRASFFGSKSREPALHIYQYQPEEDSWLAPVPRTAGRIIRSMSSTLDLNKISRTDCLVARVIPKEYMDQMLYEENGDEDIDEDEDEEFEYSQ